MRKKIIGMIILCMLSTTGFVSNAKPIKLEAVHTGYSDTVDTREDYTRIIVAGKKMDNARIVTKILRGHFFDTNAYPGIPATHYVKLDQSTSEWGIGTINCTLARKGKEKTDDGGRTWNQSVTIKGNPRVIATNMSLTLTAAIEMVSKSGVELGIGSDKATNEEQVRAAFGGVWTMGCTVTLTEDFTMPYNVNTIIKQGAIYVTCK
jgi:hypothetical protein